MMVKSVIKRAVSSDAKHINKIANSDDVFPYISDTGMTSLDFTNALLDNIAYTTDHGVIFFVKRNKYVYNFHTFFSSGGRGRHARLASRQAAFEMFTKTGALELSTYQPHDAPHSKPPKTFGFKSWYDRTNYIRGVSATCYRLEINDWIVRSPECLRIGKKIAAQAKTLLGEKHLDWNDYYWRYCGAFIAMVEGGEHEKAFHIYNNWASTAGVSEVEILNSYPMRAKVGACELKRNENGWSLEKCQQH